MEADLKDVDGRLMNGADHRAAGVDCVPHSAHHNRSSPCVQAYRARMCALLQSQHTLAEQLLWRECECECECERGA